MKKVYISGSGETELSLASKDLKKADYEPVIPSGALGDRLKILLDMDAIFMLEGWDKIKESKIEHTLASELGLEIIYSGHWNVDKYVEKMPARNKAFVSLFEARRLDNLVKSDHAFVYDMFAGIKGESDASDHAQLMKDFEDFARQIPDRDAPLEDWKFELVPVSTFDSQEQIEFLISKKKFFYAPEVK